MSIAWASAPRPALSFVTGDAGYGAGIMVSASHNPADDNGLKVVDGRGLKLDDVVEDELEALMWRADELREPHQRGPRPRGGRARGARPVHARTGRALAARARGSVRVSLDCANGSGGVVAPEILGGDRRRRAASTSTSPTACNINLDCGATAPAALAELVTREARTSASRSTATPIGAWRSTSAARSSTATS